MINSWSLAYEELYGDMDKEYPIKEDKMTDKSPSWYEWDRNGQTVNPFVLGADEGTVNVNTPVFGKAGPDTITFNSDSVFTGSRLKGGATVGFKNNDTDDTVIPYWEYSGALGEDHISLSSLGNLNTSKPQPDLKDGSNRKYEEDKSISDLKDYVASTYQGHYTNNNSNVQTLDLIHSVGDAESFCRSNAIKYLSRYDKKGQAKRDILKAMHYCLLLYYFSGNTNDETPTRGYETF